MKTVFQGLRSPREKIAGWVHLPRFVDKIRLHQAGKLPPDYQPSFATKGFDLYWLEASGVNKDLFINFVSDAKNDQEVEAWVKTNARKTPQEIEAFNQKILGHGRTGDVAERFSARKKELGLSHRNDVQCFVDLIDFEEGRL